MPGTLPCPDLSGLLDRSAEEEELFGNGGLAGVRMADDGKGASAADLLLVMLLHVSYLKKQIYRDIQDEQEKRILNILYIPVNQGCVVTQERRRVYLRLLQAIFTLPARKGQQKSSLPEEPVHGPRTTTFEDEGQSHTEEGQVVLDA